jgi:hypothetical protein
MTRQQKIALGIAAVTLLLVLAVTFLRNGTSW